MGNFKVNPTTGKLDRVESSTPVAKLIQGGNWSLNLNSPAPVTVTSTLLAGDVTNAAPYNDTYHISHEQLTLANTATITSGSFLFRRQGTPTAQLRGRIRVNSGGSPGAVLISSTNLVDGATLQLNNTDAFNNPSVFTFPAVPLPAGDYFITVDIESGTSLFPDRVQLVVGTANTRTQSVDDAANWGVFSNEIWFEYSYQEADTLELDNSATAYVAVTGINKGINAIPVQTIDMGSDGDVAYIEPEYDGIVNDNKTVTVAAESAVPDTAHIIARNLGDHVIVGDSHRVEDGDSKKLYEDLSGGGGAPNIQMSSNMAFESLATLDVTVTNSETTITCDGTKDVVIKLVNTGTDSQFFLSGSTDTSTFMEAVVEIQRNGVTIGSIRSTRQKTASVGSQFGEFNDIQYVDTAPISGSVTYRLLWRGNSVSTSITSAFIRNKSLMVEEIGGTV